MRRARLQYKRSPPPPPPKSRYRDDRTQRSEYKRYVPYGRDIDRDTRDKNEDDRSSYFCDICKQEMASKETYLSHCQSAFHKEKENNAVKAQNENIWKCHSCEKTFPSKISLDQHCLVVRHQPLYRIEGLPKTGEVEKHDKEREQSPLRKVFSFGPLMPPNYCDVCKVDCLNPSNLRIHMESWRHRAAVDRKKEEEETEKEKTNKEDSEVKKEIKDDDKDNEGKKKPAFPDSLDFHCDLCCIRVSGRTAWFGHVQGKKHKRRLEIVKPPYNCRQCDRRYASEREYSEHLESIRHIDKLDFKDEKKLKDKGEDDRRLKEIGKDDGGSRPRDRSREGSLRRERRDSDDRGTKYSRRSRDRSDSLERVQTKDRSRRRSREKKDGKTIKKNKDESPNKDKNKAKQDDNKKKEKWVKVKDNKEKEIKAKVELKYDEEEEDREVRIKEDENKDEVHDLREKLNKGKNIVITKKVKDDKGLDIIDNEERQVSEGTHDITIRNQRENPKDFDDDFLKIRLRSDIMMQEQLLKEHSIEILRYKDSEDEYKRLCLEESFLRRRLAMFRENDPRRENDLDDLIRVERAIGEVREELEVRDMMIQEKERALILLKNRMNEQLGASSQAASSVQVIPTENDAVKQQEKAPEMLIESAEPDNNKVHESATKVKQQEDTPDKNKTADLRAEIEKERLLKKLGPELSEVDPALRQRILSALSITGSESMNVNEDKSDLREELDNNREIERRNTPSRDTKDKGMQQKSTEAVKSKRSSLGKEQRTVVKEHKTPEKPKQQHRETSSKKSKSKEHKSSESSDSSDEDDDRSSKKKKNASSKKKSKPEKRKKSKSSKVDSSPEVSKESRKKKKSVSPVTKKRHRSPSSSSGSSSDERKSKKSKLKKKDSDVDKSKKIKKTSKAHTVAEVKRKPAKDHAREATKISPNIQTRSSFEIYPESNVQPIAVVLKKRPHNTSLSLYDDENDERSLSPMITEEFSDRIPVRRELTDSRTGSINPMQRNERPREQFALWKSTNVDVNKEDNREDIWETALGPGPKESSDPMDVDIFANSDEDSNDFRQGRLIKPILRAGRDSSMNREDILMNRPLGMQRETASFTGRRTMDGRSPTADPANTEKYVTELNVQQSSSMSQQTARIPQPQERLPQQPERLPQQPGRLLQQQERLPQQPGRLTQQPGRLPQQQERLPQQQKQLPLQQERLPPQQLPDDRDIMGRQTEMADNKPRGILKRGILKKPTEKFVEKDNEMKNKEQSTEKKMDDKIPGLSYTPSRESVGAEKEGEPSERKITPNDLEKINFILESFKKQYGSEWDSSQIESDLKMVLGKQHLQMASNKPPEQESGQSRSVDRPTDVGQSLDKMPESFHDPVRREDPDQPSRYDYEDMRFADQRSSQKNPLFPVKIPALKTEQPSVAESLSIRRGENIKNDPGQRFDGRESPIIRQAGEPRFDKPSVSKEPFDVIRDDRSQRLPEPMFRGGAQDDDYRNRYPGGRESMSDVRSIESRGRSRSPYFDGRPANIENRDHEAIAIRERPRSPHFDGRPGNTGSQDPAAVATREPSRSPYYDGRPGNIPPDWPREDSDIRGRQQRGPPYDASMGAAMETDKPGMHRYESRDTRMFEDAIYHQSSRPSEYNSADTWRRKVAASDQGVGSAYRGDQREIQHRGDQREIQHRGPVERERFQHPPDQQMKGSGYDDDDNYTPNKQRFSPVTVHPNEPWQGDRRPDWGAPRRWKEDERSFQEDSYVGPIRIIHNPLPFKPEEQRPSSAERMPPRPEPPNNPMNERLQNKANNPTMERSPMRDIIKRNEDADAFKYILKTANEQISRGMFYCTVCKVFLATENERTIHAHTQAHIEAVSKKDNEATAPPAFKSAPSTPRMPFTSMRGNPRSAFGSNERNMPRPPMMQRGERPGRPYEPRGRQFRSRDNFNPRPSGPYY